MTVQPTESILIVDFGSQVTQLIARRIREAGVYSEIAPFNAAEEAFHRLQPKGIIYTHSNPTDSVARILALNSPPGLEGYFRAITEATEATSPPSGGPVDLEKRLALAPDYGIEILLGH